MILLIRVLKNIEGNKGNNIRRRLMASLETVFAETACSKMHTVATIIGANGQ